MTALIPSSLMLEIEGGKVVEAGVMTCTPLPLTTHEAFNPPRSLRFGTAWIKANSRFSRSAYLWLEDGSILFFLRGSAIIDRDVLCAYFCALGKAKELHVITHRLEVAWPEKATDTGWPWSGVER